MPFFPTINWLKFEDDVEVKRAYIFALVYGYDNSKIDIVREIPKGQLNARIREIEIKELLEHRRDQHKLEKRWRYISAFFHMSNQRQVRCQILLHAYCVLFEIYN